MCYHPYSLPSLVVLDATLGDDAGTYLKGQYDMSSDLNASVQSAIDAAQSGANPMDAAFADVPTSGMDENDNVNAVTKLLDEEENQEGTQPAEGQPATDEPNTEAAADSSKEAVKPGNGDIEKLVVTGPNGKEEIEINFSDREAIKKAYSMAHGARKWQAAKDLAEKKLKEIEPDYVDAVKTRDTIVDTFKEKGFKGLANLLLQDESGWQKLIDAEVERQLVYRSATPDAKAKMDAEARYDEMLRKMQYQEEKNKLDAEKIAKQREAAAAEAQKVAEESFNTMAATALKMHSFEGKLGDAELESRLNDSVWDGVRKALAKLPDETDITPQLLDGLVAKEAALFGKGLGKKVESEVKQKIETKKQDSATKLASAAQQGMGKSGMAEKFSDALDKGDTASAIKAWLSGGLKKR